MRHGNYIAMLQIQNLSCVNEAATLLDNHLLDDGHAYEENEAWTKQGDPDQHSQRTSMKGLMFSKLARQA